MIILMEEDSKLGEMKVEIIQYVQRIKINLKEFIHITNISEIP